MVTPRRVYHKYYNVVCNPLLWFLQHYMWNPPYNPTVDASVHNAWETGYVPVNQAFAKQVVEEAKESGKPAVVVVQDYHMYLLAEMVRKELPDALIHHYVHIPWPTPRYWQMVPRFMVRSICAALCHADTVGFQTPQDRQSFLDSVEEFLPAAEVDRSRNEVLLEDQRTRVRVYPTSINVEEVRRIAASPRATEYEARLRPYLNEATIVRIDRAEPNKNVIRGFKAYDLLLSRHPELHGKVTFWAFLVPSRTHIRQYQRYMEEIEGLINQVNHNHGTQDWQPIRPFMENNYTQAIAGMKLYDVLLVNPIIDGMNLVAKEGPVVNTRDGVVVLSETSGAYHEMAGGGAGGGTDGRGRDDGCPVPGDYHVIRGEAGAVGGAVREGAGRGHPALADAATGRHWELAVAVDCGWQDEAFRAMRALHRKTLLSIGREMGNAEGDNRVRGLFLSRAAVLLEGGMNRRATSHG